jgi:hypothetical protein
MMRVLTVATCAALVAGCGPILHTEMLGESIQTFASRLKNPATEKVWITSPADNACDNGCQGCGGGGGKDKGGGGVTSALGGLFSAATGPKDGSSSYDRLAYEVFSNYLTTRKRFRVVESHRHNYATELGVETRKKVELSDGNNKVSTMSCEDLCLLDEAKKRKADKVLVYHIISMTSDTLTIHFRLSDVPTGVVEASTTLRVENLRAHDYSGVGGGSKQRAADPND